MESPGTVCATGADRWACWYSEIYVKNTFYLLHLHPLDLCLFYLFSVSLKFSVFPPPQFTPLSVPFFNCFCPSLWISLSQTPLQLSRCYDKPWLVNSKAGTHVRDSHCPDLQLLSPEVEYGFAEWDTVTKRPSLMPRTCPALFPDMSPMSLLSLGCLLTQLIDQVGQVFSGVSNSDSLKLEMNKRCLKQDCLAAL